MNPIIQKAILISSNFFTDMAGGSAAVRAVTNNVTDATDDFVKIMSRDLGADQNVLRNSLDSAYDVTKLRGELENASGNSLLDTEFDRISKAREYFLNRSKEGNYDTAGSYTDIAKNLNETGEVFGGYSRAGQGRPVSAITKMFDLEDNRTISQELGMLGGAALLGGAMNYATGGEFGAGAGVGALAAVGIRGAGKIVQESMPEIETAMMKRLLGEADYKKIVAKKDVSVVDDFKGKTFGDVAVAHPDAVVRDIKGKVTYKELTDDSNTNVLSLEDYSGYRFDMDSTKKLDLKNRIIDENDPSLRNFILQEGASVRTQALETIGKMTPDQVKAKGIGSSYMQKLLTDNKRGSIGVNMRAMTIGGAALAGVPFTGRRNDHSSGFNKNRGNKI